MALGNHDKAKLLAGKDFWTTQRIGAGQHTEVPPAILTDGPNGVRKQDGSFGDMQLGHSVPATCFPSACASACSWDIALMEAMGRAIGEECRHENVAVNLGPGVNIKRHPLGGRNFEYYSEDPLVAGAMAAAYIRGVQSTGVGACIKHFAGNSQETGRMITDSLIDERTLNDIYLRPFQIAVRESHPAAIMTAYNKLDGTYCSQNAELLDKLRDEWGYEGAVITDWGAMSESVPSVAAGLDLCMPGPRPDHVRAIEQAVANGTLPQTALDRAFANVARLAKEHANPDSPFTCDYVDHLAIAQLMAEASGVLLKNGGENPVLPLAVGSKVALIGSFARTPRYQGSGSSRVNPIELDSALGAFREADWNVDYAAGYDVETGKTTDALLSEAELTAKAADVAIVFVGLPDSFESEGFDRKNMKLPSSMNELVARVAAANPNTVAVIASGGPVTLPWKDQVPAIMATYLAGCQSGHALFNLLTGAANPSGKLAETWPASITDTALGTDFPAQGRQVEYIEGPFVGYRYYDTAGVMPAYAFGHGLSYTTFSFSDLQIKPAENAYLAECTVTNTGSRDGAQVAQLYVSAEMPAVPMPKQQLADFCKVHLKAGESKRVRFTLGPQAFGYWDADGHRLRVDEGKYKVHVCASSRDVHLKAVLALDATAPFKVMPTPKVSEERVRQLKSYYRVGRHPFSSKSFRALYGRPLPPMPEIRPFTPDSPFKDLQVSTLGRKIYSIATSAMALAGTDSDSAAKAMIEHMIDDMPLRAATMGGVSYGLVCRLCDVLNGNIAGKDVVAKLIGALKAKIQALGK